MKMTAQPETLVSLFLKRKKMIGGVLGIIIGFGIAMQAPPAGLSAAGLKAIAILCWAVTYWIFDVFPDFVVGRFIVKSNATDS